MWNYIKNNIIAITIGVLGFLSALVTLFININDKVSIKWLLFIIFISLVIIVLLISFIINSIAIKDNNIKQLKLKYLNKETEKGYVYLNLSNILFDYGDIVKIYELEDNIERFIGIGVINHIQEEQKIYHINFMLKKANLNEVRHVYFSLKLNKDELNILFEAKGV